MKILQLFFALFLAGTLMMGCDEPPEQTNEKIDATAEGLKKAIDVFSEKTKDIVNDKELQSKLKDLVKDLGEEGKDIASELNEIFDDKSPEWKRKIEELKNDPKFREQLEKLKEDGKDLQDIINNRAGDISEDKELQGKLENLAKDLEAEGKDIANELTRIFDDKSPEWERKIEQLKNDPTFKKQLEKLKEDGNGLKEIFEEIEAELNKKN